MKLLIIEDDVRTAEFIIRGLKEHGHVVDHADNGKDGLFLAAGEKYDALVIDRMLPGLDGLSILKMLRSTGNFVPSIFLTTMDGIDDRVEGLEAGADDYLVKPFAMPELEARLLAIMRRRRNAAFQDHYEIGDLILDASRFTVTRAGRSIRLSAKQFDLLHLLMRESPNLVTRDAVERALWGDAVPDSDALRSHFYNLRKLVDKDFDYELIETVPGKGFRLVARN